MSTSEEEGGIPWSDIIQKPFMLVFDLPTISTYDDLYLLFQTIDKCASCQDNALKSYNFSFQWVFSVTFHLIHVPYVLSGP